jgi:hypothetical protein
MSSYDAWATAGPPEPEPAVCPKCGKDWEELQELEIDGLDGHGIMAYPLRIRDTRPNAGPDAYRYIGGAQVPASRNVRFIDIWKCDCGWIGTDDALVTVSEYEGR